MITKESLGRAIADFREKNGDTQEELADRADVPVATLRSWEQGRAVPSAVTLHKIAGSLNVDANKILIRADELGPEKDT
jgi:transcriptional regulator with XRE-family HTH domain